MTKRYLVDDQKGVALFTVVLIFLVLVTMLGGVMFAAVVNQRNSILAKDHTAVYYAAESGINMDIVKIEEIITKNGNNKGQITLDIEKLMEVGRIYDFSNNMGKSSWANVIIEKSPTNIASKYPSYTFFRVVSTGNVGDNQRVLFVDVGYRLVAGPGEYDVFSAAVITKGSITVDKWQGQIFGPIASNMVGNATINLGNHNNVVNCHGIATPNKDWKISLWQYEVGDVSEKCISVAQDLPKEIVFGEIKNLEKEIIDEYKPGASAVNITKTNNDGILNLSNGNYFTLSKLDTTGTLNVLLDSSNNENETIFVFLDSNIASNNGSVIPSKIIVEGPGRLVFVSRLSDDNDVRLDSYIRYKKGEEEVTDQSKVSFVLIYGDNPPTQTSKWPEISMGSGDEFVGSILSDSKGNINFQGIFGGYLVTNAMSVYLQTPGSLSGKPEETIWIYAPNAHIQSHANSNFYGSIMGASYNMFNPQSELHWLQIEAKYPFEDWTPLPYTSIKNSPAILEVKYLPIIEN